jgi:hypothetical protein
MLAYIYVTQNKYAEAAPILEAQLGSSFCDLPIPKLEIAQRLARGHLIIEECQQLLEGLFLVRIAIFLIQDHLLRPQRK